MNTDSELLELAAKAAGLVVTRGVDADGEICPMFFDPQDDSGWELEWNPLTDDGDALRLAVKIGWVPSRVEFVGLAMSQDPYAATRRAIVRAAAEIGKDMMTKVFVVLEEDRGCGVSVAGVFSTLEAAQSYLSGPCGSNCYLASIEGSSIDESVMG